MNVLVLQIEYWLYKLRKIHLVLWLKPFPVLEPISVLKNNFKKFITILLL